MTTKRKKQGVNGSIETDDSIESTFDVSLYTLSSDVETKVLTIPETGDSFEIKVRPISWSKRNKLVSKCLNWDDSGTVEFDGDVYVRGCLKEMIVEAPWGATSEAFLMSIDTRLGAALEALVPQAFEDTLGKSEIVKKAQ